MRGYRDVKKAAYEDIHQIWVVWGVCGVIGGAVVLVTDGVPVLGVTVFWLWFVLGVAASIAAVGGSWIALRKVDQARKSALK